MSYRALLTKREREVLCGDADVSQNYLNQIRYRVRQKISRLEGDITLLADHQPELADQLHETVMESLNHR